MKTYRYGATVPLIGGLVVAAKQATGVDPEFILSYTPFGENEKHVRANFPDVPHYRLDEDGDGGFVAGRHEDLDFVNAVCPCAGLSLLSTGSPEQRAAMNSWMLNTAKYVTGTLKPKVFWGENAPALYSNGGALVRSQLREIAEKNGYAFSIYATNTEFHGIPQSRKRTFYFFWRDTDAPAFEYFRRPSKSLAEYLAEVPVGADRHTQEDIDRATEKLQSEPYIRFLNDKYDGNGLGDVRRYLRDKERKGTTVLSYLIKTEQLAEAGDWLRERGMLKHREVDRIIKKLADGKGFWDSSNAIYKGDGVSSTLIARTLEAIHPVEDRIMTVRENMHMMGLPLDYKLVTEGYNAICQNVPVCTGRDMTLMVMEYLEGNLKSSGARFVLQSNHKQQIDHQESSLLGF